jgi:transcriptional regulator with XRE-family HTH domain
MKNNNQLRKMIKKYLEHPKSMAQIEIARQLQISKGTLSDFLRGKDFKIDHELYRRIVDIVAPWEYDFEIRAGKIKTRLMKDRYTEDDMRKIFLTLAKKYQTTA